MLSSPRLFLEHSGYLSFLLAGIEGTFWGLHLVDQQMESTLPRIAGPQVEAGISLFRLLAP